MAAAAIILSQEATFGDDATKGADERAPEEFMPPEYHDLECMSPLSPPTAGWHRRKNSHSSAGAASVQSSAGSSDDATYEHAVVSKARASQFMRPNRFAIHPEKSNVYLYFKTILLSALLYTLTVTPFEVAFKDHKGTVDWIFFINRIVDGVFLLDFLLCFHLMYQIDTRKTVIWVSSRDLLVRHYLKTWCLPDILGVIPFDLIAHVAYPNGNRRGRILRLLRLFKLCRGWRERDKLSLDQLLGTKLSFALSPQLTQVLGFMVALLFVSHWMGCFFGFLGNIQDHSNFEQGSWLTVEAEKGHSTAIELWVAATYWGVLTLTSVGYGDIVPVSASERVGATLLMVVAGCIWATLLSQFTANAAARGQHNRRFNAMMIEVDQVMTQARCSQELIAQVRRYFRIKHKNGDNFSRLKVLMKDMTSGLQSSILKATNRDWCMSIGYLVECSAEFRTEVCSKLQQKTYTRGERFGQIWHLYVVKHGMVARLGPFLRILSKSCVWGEDIILNDINLLEKLEVLALTFVEILMMGKGGLVEILRLFPADGIRIRKHALRMALQRGILQLAHLKCPDVRCLQLRYETFVQIQKLERLTSYLVQSPNSRSHPGLRSSGSKLSERRTQSFAIDEDGELIEKRDSFASGPDTNSTFDLSSPNFKRVCSGVSFKTDWAGDAGVQAQKFSRSLTNAHNLFQGVKSNHPVSKPALEVPSKNPIADSPQGIFQRLDEQNQKVDSLGRNLRDKMNTLDLKMDQLMDVIGNFLSPSARAGHDGGEQPRAACVLWPPLKSSKFSRSNACMGCKISGDSKAVGG